jgi:hypothetical protein
MGVAVATAGRVGVLRGVRVITRVTVAGVISASAVCVASIRAPTNELIGH